MRGSAWSRCPIACTTYVGSRAAGSRPCPSCAKPGTRPWTPGRRRRASAGSSGSATTRARATGSSTAYCGRPCRGAARPCRRGHRCLPPPSMTSCWPSGSTGPSSCAMPTCRTRPSSRAIRHLPLVREERPSRGAMTQMTTESMYQQLTMSRHGASESSLMQVWRKSSTRRSSTRLLQRTRSSAPAGSQISPSTSARAWAAPRTWPGRGRPDPGR
mmetsp:Transcript_32687/g.91809  ORF Transcript_32687/g.91809 Transcript_32687/m.91809 type:complete len:215 (-) Transcript_32687:303-947(-)